MNKEAITYGILYVAAILCQVLIFNRIALFNVAVPFVFIIVIIRLPLNLSPNWVLTLSFLAGFLVDIFSDTPGVNSLSCVLLAASRKLLFYAYVPRDDKTKTVVPCLYSMGWANYSKYLITLTTLYCLLVFSIEFFSFAPVREIAIMTASSSLLSFILIFAIDSLMRNERL